MHAIDPSPLLISLATTATATAITFFLGLLAAWRMLSVRNSLRGWLDGVLTLPLILPPTVVGYFLLLIFGRRSPIGLVLEHVGITIVFSWPATVIAATVVAFPLMYRTTLGAFEQVNPALLDAARTLGASEARIFREVLLPLAGPGILAGAVLAFARALGEFGATLMLAGNIPGHTQTLPIAIFSAVEGGDRQAAALWVVVIVVLSLAMIRLLHMPASSLLRNRFRSSPATGTFAPVVIPVTLHNGDWNGRQPHLEMSVRKALSNFTLQIDLAADERPVGLLGASGAGKSITLKMIAGVAQPDAGHIELSGRTLFDSARGIDLPAQARRIGVVFQDYALFPHRTVAENAGFSLHCLPRAERQQCVQQLLASLHIAHLADRRPAQISGGERQRVAIARCLAMQPEALLFDEPFAALDPHLRRSTEEQLRETLRDYRGVVLFITHDMEEAFRFCPDLVVLSEGRKIASGPRQQLFSDPRSIVAAQLTGCKNIAAARQIDETHAHVDAWNCTLTAERRISDSFHAVGYRSHYFHFQTQAKGENVFPCWLVDRSESPHEMTLYLRLHAAPQPGEKPHIQADVAKQLWQQLAAQPQPWQIQFAPESLLQLDE
ncbi:MAG: molybdate ABC transporter permease subunit [Terracidiphilus sp.]|nr:molybdate ABC transporter permease subunit [Terracidiphilus sp.]